MLIIADDIDGEALPGLIVNNARGTLVGAAIKAPGFGDTKLEIMDDIAALTGATVISPKKGMTMDKFDQSWLGETKALTINKKTTTIIDGMGGEEAIKDRIEKIKAMIDLSKSNYETEKMQERLGKLSGGVAIIKIGAESEIEMKEKKDRVNDALAATKAAVDEGILPGGGIALRAAVKDLELSNVEIDNEDQKAGVSIVIEACKAPFNMIMTNAGLNPEVIWNKIMLAKPEAADETWHIGNNGFDARSEKVVDMFKAGIIDPTKVTRVALEKAASIAGTMLITECVLTNLPPKNGSTKDSNFTGMGMM